jgi:hypothetical protein
MGWVARVLGVPAEGDSVPPCRSCGRPVDVAGLVCIRICESCVVLPVDSVEGGPPHEAA